MRLDEPGLQRWGQRIGGTVETPVVIGLRGVLGAGKSVLARAIGAGAGVTEAMPSPSYNLLLRYDGAPGRAVVHMDLYRLDDTDELWELGWSQIGGTGEIVIVEWPERAGAFMPPDHWVVELRVPDDESLLRDVEVHRIGTPPELPAFPMSVSTNG